MATNESISNCLNSGQIDTPGIKKLYFLKCFILTVCFKNAVQLIHTRLITFTISGFSLTSLKLFTTGRAPYLHFRRRVMTWERQLENAYARGES